MAVVVDGSSGAITGVTTVDSAPDLVSIQTFNSAGSYTWTKPANINRVRVFVTGAGAGGGGSNDDDAGGGGGAGGTAIKIIDVSSVSTVSVTVGAGSRGANNNEFPSLAGGSSSFGAYCTGNGGNMSPNWGRGGSGGSATGGDINIYGGDAYTGQIDGANASEAGGTGGASYWGSGGAGGSYWSARVAASVYGSGGGGGQGDSNQSGSAGMSGIVIVEEYR